MARPLSILRNEALPGKINAFLESPAYVLAIFVLCVLANTLQLELFVYTIYVAVAIYVLLFGKDLLPLMPLFLASYIAPSVRNNPGRYDDSIFTAAGGGVYLLCLATLLLSACIFYIIHNWRSFFTKKPALLSGILVLSAGYLLSGIGSSQYAEVWQKNILFALLQSLSILLPYWLFCNGVDWSKPRAGYFSWIGFAAGCALVLQILHIYCTSNVIVNGIIVRGKIFTGWGVRNNIGAMLAMMIPFAFHLATRYRKGWLGTAVGTIFLVGIFFTCSRNAILISLVIYIASVIAMLRYTPNRKDNMVTLISLGIGLLIILIFFHNHAYRLFSSLLQTGLDPNGRTIIYLNGLKLFTEYPIFGVSFYPPEDSTFIWATQSGFSSFFPGRWHNTIVQLLAGGGIVGLATYAFHRYQTVKHFLKNISRSTVFIAISIAALLLSSLLDCHFFNIGPVLFYAMALATMENATA